MPRTLHPAIYAGFGLDLVGIALLVAAFVLEPAGATYDYLLYGGVAVLVISGAVMFYGFQKRARTA